MDLITRDRRRSARFQALYVLERWVLLAWAVWRMAQVLAWLWPG